MVKPKSPSLTRPSPSMKTFSSLMSLQRVSNGEEALHHFVDLSEFEISCAFPSHTSSIPPTLSPPVNDPGIVEPLEGDEHRDGHMHSHPPLADRLFLLQQLLQQVPACMIEKEDVDSECMNAGKLREQGICFFCAAPTRPRYIPSQYSITR